VKSHEQQVGIVGAPGWKLYGRLRVFLRPYTARLLWILAVSLAATTLGLAQPFLSKLLIDSALLRRDWRALCWVAGLM
jgi:ATP-binding cassette subfamily B protein